MHLSLYTMFRGFSPQILAICIVFVSRSYSQPCNGGPCGEHAVYCFDEAMEQWECKCTRGFKSISVTPINCTDINECWDVSMHNCGNYTRCRNAIGYYTCECLAGFTQLKANGGKWECSDFNECGAWPRNNCGNGTECVNSLGGYSCRCLDGFNSPRISFGQTICSDIDECAANSHNCGEGTWCENLSGSYRCNCNMGYRRVGLTAGLIVCTDVDECAVQYNGRCGFNSDCINTPGSYTCTCRSGYISGDGRDCVARALVTEPPPNTFSGLSTRVQTTNINPLSSGLEEPEEEKGSGDLYIGVGVGIGAAFVVLAIFFMVAYIAGSERKKGKQSIQHDIHKYQVDRKHQFVDTDSPIYEDIGPPITSISPTVDRTHVAHVPFKSATLGRMDGTHVIHSPFIGSESLGRRGAIRSLSQSVDNKSVHNWRLVHNEINQALYATTDVEPPIYCNTLDRPKRLRPTIHEPMVEELYYSPVYHSCDNSNTLPVRNKPPIAPKSPSLVDNVRTHKPKRHVVKRKKQRLWISRVHSDPESTTEAPDLPPGHPAFRRLASDGDLIDTKKQQSGHDLMEGTILRCGDKYYILEPEEKDEMTGKPITFAISNKHTDDAL